MNRDQAERLIVAIEVLANAHDIIAERLAHETVSLNLYLKVEHPGREGGIAIDLGREVTDAVFAVASTIQDVGADS